MQKTGQLPGRRAGLAAAFAMALAGGAAAQPAAPAIDVFTAYAVPVDAEAESAAAAREVALANGQREALLSVLRRLTLAVDWERLPPVDAAQAAAMVESIQVEDEKSSTVRYLASLTIEFDDDKVRGLLAASGLPFTESRAQPTLVLPVFERDGAFLLFEEDNPWLAGWIAYRAPPGALFPLVIPIGDLEDVATVDADLALAGDAAALAQISGRYGATNVLVAAAGLADGELRIDLRWFGPSQQDAESVVVPAGTPEEDVAALIDRAVADTATTLEERWKQQTLQMVGGAMQTLEARLPIDGLQDWIAARSLLGRNGMVKRFEVASMTRQSVQLALHYQGEPEQLALSLAQNDLTLENDGEGWLLTLRRNAGGTARE